ncbi:MAG: PHP domain-containing protein, partial [Candidatus Eisenbacteria bacterium]|nr:PHP domain-containing protein [Candidatus Eisenbacteria bacterium]
MRNACLNFVSEYSPARGTASVEAMLDRARQNRYDMVGLVDRATLLGAAPFIAGARRRGLDPVIGVEFEVACLADPAPPTLDSLTAPVTFPLVLFAESETGRRNLADLVSLAHTRAGQPFLIFEDLAAHHHGLIAQSPGLVGEVSSRIQRGQADQAERLALRLAEVFGRSAVYLGVSLHGLPAEARLADAVAALARKSGVSIVASDQVDHLDDSDRLTRNARLALAHGRPLVEVSRDQRLAPDSQFRTPAERRRLYRDHPEALENEVALAERCLVANEVTDAPAGLDYPLPGGRTAVDYLASIVAVRCPKSTRHRRRLENELAEVKRLDLAGWFLLQWDARRYAHRHGIDLRPMSGAVRSSLVAWFLGLTDIDPVAANLDAAHFYLEATVGSPTITFRVSAGQRSELAAYLEHRYGRERVNHPGRTVRLSPRAAVREAGVLLGMAETDIAAAARHVPESPGGDVAAAVARDEHLARRYVRESATREWLDLARALSGLVARVEADRDRLVLVANGTTTTRPVVRDGGGRPYREYLPESVEFDGADTTGTPVAGGPVVIHLLTTDFEASGTGAGADREPLIVEASLEHVARRQPALAARFRARATGVEATPPIASRLKPILARTHGLLLEEEQLADMARVLAGFDSFQAEAFRRALTRPVSTPGVTSSQREAWVAAERRRWRLSFVDGAVAGGLEPDQAESVFLALAEAAPR